MAGYGEGAVSWLDTVKTRDPKGMMAKIVETIKPKNGLIDKLPLLTCNDGTSHEVTREVSVPAPQNVGHNEGIVGSKMTTEQVRFACGNASNKLEIPVSILDKQPDKEGYRMKQLRGLMKGMRQGRESEAWYGNQKVNTREFTGLTPHYNSLSGENAAQIINFGDSSGTIASMWLAVVGEDTLYAAHPEHQMTGLRHVNASANGFCDNIDSSNGGTYQVTRDYLYWDMAMVIETPQNIVRICNINTTALATSGITLLTAMLNAYERIQDKDMGQLCWFMHPTLKTFLRHQITNKANVNLTVQTVAGEEVMAHDGVPIIESDGLTKSEAVVS